jgi:hypothetical protein
MARARVLGAGPVKHRACALGRDRGRASRAPRRGSAGSRLLGASGAWLLGADGIVQALLDGWKKKGRRERGPGWGPLVSERKGRE